MGLADSVKVSRDSTYSGYLRSLFDFAYGTFTLYGLAVPNEFCYQKDFLLRTKVLLPHNVVWAVPLSLAATYGIDFSFYSSGYLDVSVLQVSDVNLWIQFTPVRESTGQRLFNSSP